MLEQLAGDPAAVTIHEAPGGEVELFDNVRKASAKRWRRCGDGWDAAVRRLHERAIASVSPEAIARGEALFAGPGFSSRASGLEHLPPMDVSEIAFAGRSNVGKSSLINALVGQKALARTSNTPGRTQELNFFGADAGITIVDMPGYGYARAPKARSPSGRSSSSIFSAAGQSSAASMCWSTAATVSRTTTSRRKTLDRAAVSYQVVLTKADKPSARDLEKVRIATLAALSMRPAAFPVLLETSSSTASASLSCGQQSPAASSAPIGRQSDAAHVAVDPAAPPSRSTQARPRPGGTAPLDWQRCELRRAGRDRRLGRHPSSAGGSRQSAVAARPLLASASRCSAAC